MELNDLFLIIFLFYIAEQNTFFENPLILHLDSLTSGQKRFTNKFLWMFNIKLFSPNKFGSP